MILGVLGAIAFAILWLFCARRRQRKLSREFEANAIPPWAPGGPLKTEVDMEERYAGILEALNAGMGAGRNVRLDDSGEVSVLGDVEAAGAGEGALATRASSPMLPGEDLDIDGPHVFPLSPPPPHPTHTPHPSASSSAYGYGYSAPPPPSAYIPHASNGARRRSSPGPDASAWFGGYTVAPAASNYSHSSAHLFRTDTASSTHFLMRNDTGTGTLTRTHTESGTLTRTETGTRTRTGSEEPLLTRAGSGSEFGYGGGRDGRLGSAFGSYEGSVNGCGLAPTSPSLSASGHGFATSPSSGVSGHGYGLATSPSPSRTASSFDVLRSISSKGALRSMDSHGYGFGYGFGSASSAGTGSYRGPGLGLAIAPTSFSSDGRSGVKSAPTSGFSSDAPPTSFSDRRTGIKSDRKGWKKGKRERESMGSCSTASASGSGSVDGHGGVRAFFGRLRRGNTPSPKPSSGRDVESEGCDEKSAGAKEVFSAFVSPATPEPVFGAFATPTPESAPLPTTPRFVLSNPDPRPSSPYIGDGHGLWPWVTVESPSAPGPATTTALGDELHLTTADGLRLATTDGLLDPRLRDPVEGRSNSSLRDFEDYSRPIGGLINNRMQSTTTFGTVDTQDFDDGVGEDVPRASWIIDGGAQ
ncbi:hypothetical protein CY34DRAFT_476533 [Suillus luteus UH-Slu-Lm8-n1]|uniref:Uncharacterized protein n=1 Tax=Suillus luteus UH-Slu-Lm8-n1 TaxID=930992 RepID=A0A0D0A687_9AGAM|nr:hypothetical protein CY34DRAFT_476533 [Suillus luteus UH-Slu-Lm8-n1]